jgi:hypothetical protein
MIDVYAPAGAFKDTRQLARELATAVMTIELVPRMVDGDSGAARTPMRTS